MSLRILLQSFYSDVHKCIKGPKTRKEAFAWEIVNLAIESTQDGGSFFQLDLEEDDKIQVDIPKLNTVLAIYDMATVDVVPLEIVDAG